MHHAIVSLCVSVVFVYDSNRLKYEEQNGGKARGRSKNTLTTTTTTAEKQQQSSLKKAAAAAVAST